MTWIIETVLTLTSHDVIQAENVKRGKGRPKLIMRKRYRPKLIWQDVVGKD